MNYCNRVGYWFSLTGLGKMFTEKVYLGYLINFWSVDAGTEFVEGDNSNCAMEWIRGKIDHSKEHKKKSWKVEGKDWLASRTNDKCAQWL